MLKLLLLMEPLIVCLKLKKCKTGLMKNFRIAFSFLALLFCITYLSAQEVPYGINYQAVARDVNGAEMVSEQIDIRFSIVSGTPQGPTEYQEVHYGVNTSKYGVFTATIGTGTVLAGEKELLRDITWETDTYFLKVEIKFLSDFHEVGVMQFLSVPYALYAGRSLEPGPVGPQGPAGDPATDDQTLSFEGINLSIDGGNTVNLASLLEFEENDSDPENEIQDLNLTDDKLKITMNVDAHEYDLSVYKDNTDAQTLSFVAASNTLSISNGNSTSLADLENTDEQQLSYNSNNRELSIDNGGTVSLGSVIAFRAKNESVTAGYIMGTDEDLISYSEEYDDGSNFDHVSGIFTAPFNGIYTFDISYKSAGYEVDLYVFKNEMPYETLAIDLINNEHIYRNKTLKLIAGDRIKLVVNTGAGTSIGPSTFSGFRVY